MLVLPALLILNLAILEVQPFFGATEAAESPGVFSDASSRLSLIGALELVVDRARYQRVGWVTPRSGAARAPRSTHQRRRR